ncbi:MAG: adenylyltransferase/cytidyltransferase family protein, partial [Deltaproteobacteria bacterium]|nr:adenylyltransferase/cytidyltransferase family protein [Deltaproteobacteria bacterium]
MKEKIAVYPGSFDPITNGHVNLVERALIFFDKIIVAVAYNPNKAALFSMEERVEMIQIALKND